MKFLICSALLLTSQIAPQSYLNIHFNDGSYKNSLIGSLKKITLSTNYDQLDFHLTDGVIRTENISELKKFTIDNFPMGEQLPVELSMFMAVIDGHSITLNWRTETEVNNYGFDIERSSNISYWSKIGFVGGSGNSNSPKEYSFTDSPSCSGKFWYRLKQIDTDGIFEYSKIISIDIRIPFQYELKQNFPNPFNPNTNINYSLPFDGVVIIKIFDLLGNVIETLVNEEKIAGNYHIMFNANELSSGVYICTLFANNFRKSIKMMVLK